MSIAEFRGKNWMNAIKQVHILKQFPSMQSECSSILNHLQNKQLWKTISMFNGLKR